MGDGAGGWRGGVLNIMSELFFERLGVTLIRGADTSKISD
jgi:hypothetical protein